MISKKLIVKFLLKINFVLIFVFVLTLIPTSTYAAAITKEAVDDVNTDNSWGTEKGYSSVDANSFEDTDGISTYKVNYVGRSDGYTYEYASIKFDLTGISGTINSASFKFYIVGLYGNPIVNLVRPNSDDPWAEEAAGYSIFPTFIIEDYISEDSNSYSNQSVMTGWNSFDVSDYIQSRIDAGATDVTFILTGLEGGGGEWDEFTFSSVNNGNNIPQLELDYIPDTTNPILSNVSPSLLKTGTTVYATSNENGELYLVAKAIYADKAALDAVGTGSKKIVAATAEDEKAIITDGLSEGIYQIYAVDYAGNLSSPSDDITIDNTAPLLSNVLPTLLKVGDSVNATSNENGILYLVPKGVYTDKTALDVVALESKKTVISTAGDAKSIEINGLSDGIYQIYAVDSIGNVSLASVDITIDTTPPSAPVITGISDDTGASGSDGETSDNTLSITGTAEANSTVEVFKGVDSIGTTTANGLGDWSFNYTGTILTDGTYNFTAKATDAAGNVSVESIPFTVKIDTVSPPAPSLPDLTAASDTGESNTDNITNDTTPTFTGISEGNNIVELFKDGLSIGTTTADGSGNWSFAAGTLADGTYSITAKSTDIAGNVSSVSAGLSITIDSIAPTVTSINRLTPSGENTNEHSVIYQITFSEAVNGVDVNDFIITHTGTAEGTVASISSSNGTVIEVEINNVSGEGTLRLDLSNSGTGIVDIAGNAASGFTGGETYSIDTVAPSVSSITRLTPASESTTSTSVTYRVTFSEAVTGVDESDFTIAGTASGTVASVSPGSGTIIDVTVNSISGDGTLRLDLNGAGTGITDGFGNVISGAFTSGQAYIVDTTLPSVVSINRHSPAGEITNSTSVIYRVTFSEAVNGVDENDFALTGTASGTIASVSSSGTTTDVTINISSNGTLGLDFNASGTGITDAAGNAISGGYTGGQTYTIDTIAPSVISINRQNPADESTNSATVTYRVTFSEAVSGVDVSDFDLTGTPSGTVTSVSWVSGTTIDVTVSSISGNGTLRLDLNESGTGITDLAGNSTSGGFTGGQSYSVDMIPPSAITISGQNSIPGGDNLTLTAEGGPLSTDSWNDILDQIKLNTGAGLNWITGIPADDLTITPASDGITVTLNNGNTSAANITADFAITASKVVDRAGNMAASNIIIDSFLSPARVTGVSSSAANGAYKVSAVIAITLTFDTAVDVTGTPVLHLETGETDRDALYAGGTGTSVLTFNYTVQAGDTSADLDYKNSNSLGLNGGTIKNKDKVIDAVLSLPTVGGAYSLSSEKNIVIDTTIPVIIQVSPTTLNAGTNINATSNETGTLYLVPKAVYQDKSDLDAAVSKRTAAATANSATTIAMSGLSEGTYQVYAVDVAENMSSASEDITVSPAPVITSAVNSTITASPTTIAANGTTPSAITVTLRDAEGNTVSGKTVTLSQGTGNSVISPASAVTNTNGRAVFTVSNTVVETVTYTADVAEDNVTLIQTATVTFTSGIPVPGITSADNSTVTASPAAIAANGTTSSAITVTLRDDEGNTLSGKTVTLSQGAGSSAITPVNAVTDANGKAVFTVRNTAAETVTYTAAVSEDNVTVTQTATVTFTAVPPTPTPSNNNSGGSGSSGGSSPSSPAAPTKPTVEVKLNDKTETIGQVEISERDNRTITTVTIDQTKIEQLLDKIPEPAENNGSSPQVIQIPVTGDSDVVTAELNGQNIKDMEKKDVILEIKTDAAAYTVPASEIKIDDISEKIGQNVKLTDIKVSIEIAETTTEKVKLVEDTAVKGGYGIVAPSVDFSISCSYNGKTVEVSKFNGYVERTIAIPEGVDPSKITTGIVLNKDGSFSHVPTTIIVIDGKYYAKINSLTNSTYSVIWNPKTFKDMEKHIFKNAVNEVASRLIMDGVNADRFLPDEKITRGEYIDGIVRALGLLRTDKATAKFKDVKAGNKYMASVAAALEYGIVAGYTDGTYRPDRLITREEAASILVNAMKIAGINTGITDDEVKAVLSKYKDKDKISKTAAKSVAICIKNGIFTGNADLTFAPKTNISRGQTAAVILNMLKKAGLI